MQFFKRIVILARNNNYITKNPFSQYQIRLQQVDREFLTMEELITIMQAKFTVRRLELIRDLFVFSCMTGLAYIDLKNLRRQHLYTIDEQLWIRINRQKSKEMSSIRLLDIPKLLLEKYDNPTLENLFPVPSNQKLNDYLKEAAKLAELDREISQVYFKGNTRHEDTYKFWEQISCHDARRTFVCCSLALGIPASVVMSCTGHSDYESMKPYIEVADETQKMQMEKWNTHQYKSGIIESMEKMTSEQLKQLFEYVKTIA